GAVQWSYIAWYEASAVATKTGNPTKFFSRRGLPFCDQHGTRSRASGAACRSNSSGDAALTGGSYVSGTLVRPEGRSAPLWNSASLHGGPAGSSATIPLTRLGRASAINQPNIPACE